MLRIYNKTPILSIGLDKLTLGSVLLFSSQCVLAAQGEVYKTSSLALSQIGNVITGLIFVLLVFVGLVFLLKRVSGVGTTSSGKLQLVDTVTVGVKEKLFLVKVCDEYLLLSLSAGKLEKLQYLGSKAEIQEADNDDFKTQLQQVVS